jgi:hypothetical protein
MSDMVWFQKFLIGKNHLKRTIKTLVEETPSINLHGRNFTNKTPRPIGISQIEEGLIGRNENHGSLQCKI